MRPAAAVRYAGFRRRLGAVLADGALLLLLDVILVRLADIAGLVPEGPGGELVRQLLSALLAAAFVVGCWVHLAGTPGKRLLDCRVVDADTLEPPDTGQALVRYVGYLVSFAGLMLGFLWMIRDRRHQGWHDKLANTVVVVGDPEDRLPDLETVRRALR